MVAGCSASCVKYLFFTFNFLLFICGSAILGVSLWARFDNRFRDIIGDLLDKSGAKYSLPEINKLYLALYIIAGIGAFLLLCGFLGCCGACCENTCLLGLFFSVVLILFLAEIAGAIYIFVKQDDVKNDLRDILVKLYADDTAEVRTGVVDMEKRLKCCGVDGCTVTTLLSPCCTDHPLAPSCTAVVFNNLKGNLNIVAIVAICLIVVELLTMIFACFLCSAIRSSAYSYY